MTELCSLPTSDDVDFSKQTSKRVIAFDSNAYFVGIARQVAKDNNISFRIKPLLDAYNIVIADLKQNETLIKEWVLVELQTNKYI